MNTQRALVGLTLVNLGILVFLLMSHVVPAVADTNSLVLRVRGLEIVDDRGRVRASIKVLPANPTVKMPDGTTGYPETVLLRMMTSNGRPNVKLAAKEDGAALVLGGESDPTYIQMLAKGTSTSLKLIDKDGREQVIKP